MYLNKDRYKNFTLLIYYISLIILILNTILIVSDKTILKFFNIYNQEIFNFCYVLIFFSIILRLCIVKPEFINNLRIIFFVIIFFIYFFKVDYYFTAKNFIQIFIVIFLSIFILEGEKKIFNIFFKITNPIIVFSIILRLLETSNFLNKSFFYFFDPSIINIFFTYNFIETDFNILQTSQYNHFNIIIFCFLILNVICKKYKDTTFNLFSIILKFFYLIFFSSLYMKFTSLLFLFLIILDSYQFLTSKKINFVLIIIFFLSPFVTSTSLVNNFASKIFSLIDYKYLSKNYCVKKDVYLNIEEFHKLEVTDDKKVCFGNQSNYYNFLSFKKRNFYQKEIINKFKHNKKNIILGLDSKQINELYVMGYFPHNSYLDILIKMGVVGYLFFFYFINYLINKSDNSLPAIFLLFSMIFDDYLIGHKFVVSILIWMCIYFNVNKLVLYEN